MLPCLGVDVKCTKGRTEQGKPDPGAASWPTELEELQQGQAVPLELPFIAQGRNVPNFPSFLRTHLQFGLWGLGWDLFLPSLHPLGIQTS